MAIVAGMLLGVGCQIAHAARDADDQPTPPAAAMTPTPAPAASRPITQTDAAQTATGQATTPALVTVRGMACVDRDLNSRCSPNEARVPDVIVHSATGIATVTDGAGQYSILAPSRSDLDISIPDGYRSVNGNLRRLHFQLLDNNNIDIPLTFDSPYDLAVVNPLQPTGSGMLTQTGTTIFNPEPIYLLLAALGLCLVVLLVVMALVLGSIRRTYRRSFAQQDLLLHDQREKDLNTQHEPGHGWQAVAEQIVADALHETISIDGDSGVLQAIAEPNPRFSVVTHDGRVVLFTTDIRLMKKARLIRAGDKIVDISAQSMASHTSAGVLWHHILALRNMRRTTPPTDAHWYVVVHTTTTRAAKSGRIRAAVMPLLETPLVRNLVALRGGR
jgi:hypothetical protein